MSKKFKIKKCPLLIVDKFVLLPGDEANLQITKEKNKNAVFWAKKNYNNEIIITLRPDRFTKKSEIKKNHHAEVATIAKITGFKEEGDFLIIELRGFERVLILETSKKKENYIDCEYHIYPYGFSNNYEKRPEVDLFLKTIKKMIRSSTLMKIGISGKDIAKLLKNQDFEESRIIDLFVSILEIDYNKKYSILESEDISARISIIMERIHQKMDENKVMDVIDSKIKRKFDSQQKEIILRERMNQIKKELGDASSKDSEIDVWRKELKNKRFPKEVKDKLIEEINRYEQMPSIAAESNISRSYIDLLIKLPWKKYGKDETNLSIAQKILEEGHYGLEKVKERIIEYLAVKIKTKRNDAPIITLVGPPGVGKTSLANSIAKAIKKPIVKISLGGLKDESEIRGHRKTYIGSMPGKIISAIKKSGVSNLVILLDEIDKMASDYRGDPTSAMLEVLDPEQNIRFQDHYLELEYDLSNVMFIATANYIDAIPGPLLDRVEIIRLNQYTSDEKLEIAIKHIIPEVIIKNSLTAKLFKISKANISYIINHYTQEAGVRSLKRQFDKLARKIVVKQLRKEIKDEFTLSKDNINDLLGKEMYSVEKLRGKAEIGLTNGMYYSSVGGGILPIEVTVFPSTKGGVKLTGSIRDVMNESAQVAVGYLRANAKKFGINFKWEENTIQIHVPSGAVPKDGPSAGVAFTTAVASALLKKKVPMDIALTGEITLRGNVYEIGGLKEKTIGAVEAGIKKIFIPYDNIKDIPELSSKVKNNATIIAVKKYDEVFQKIFQAKI